MAVIGQELHQGGDPVETVDVLDAGDGRGDVLDPGLGLGQRLVDDGCGLGLLGGGPLLGLQPPGEGVGQDPDPLLVDLLVVGNGGQVLVELAGRGKVLGPLDDLGGGGLGVVAVGDLQRVGVVGPHDAGRGLGSGLLPPLADDLVLDEGGGRDTLGGALGHPPPHGGGRDGRAHDMLGVDRVVAARPGTQAPFLVPVLGDRGPCGRADLVAQQVLDTLTADNLPALGGVLADDDVVALTLPAADVAVTVQRGPVNHRAGVPGDGVDDGGVTLPGDQGHQRPPVEFRGASGDVQVEVVDHEPVLVGLGDLLDLEGVPAVQVLVGGALVDLLDLVHGGRKVEDLTAEDPGSLCHLCGPSLHYQDTTSHTGCIGVIPRAVRGTRRGPGVMPSPGR